MTNELRFEQQKLEHYRVMVARFIEENEPYAMKNWGEGLERSVQQVKALEQKLGLRSPQGVHRAMLEMARAAQEAGKAGLCRPCEGRGRVNGGDVCGTCNDSGKAAIAPGAVAKRAAAIAAAKRVAAAEAAGDDEIHSEPPDVEAEGEGDYVLVECSECNGTGKIGDELCTECLGKGERMVNDGTPDQPPPPSKKSFSNDTEGVKQSGTPPRKPKPEARVSDLERHTPQKENVMSQNRRRLIDHGFVTIEETGSPSLMVLAREYAAEHKVPIEVAMVAVAKLTPSLMR